MSISNIHSQQRSTDNRWDPSPWNSRGALTARNNSLLSTRHSYSPLSNRDQKKEGPLASLSVDILALIIAFSGSPLQARACKKWSQATKKAHLNQLVTWKKIPSLSTYLPSTTPSLEQATECVASIIHESIGNRIKVVPPSFIDVDQTTPIPLDFSVQSYIQSLGFHLRPQSLLALAPILQIAQDANLLWNFGMCLKEYLKIGGVHPFQESEEDRNFIKTISDWFNILDYHHRTNPVSDWFNILDHHHRTNPSATETATLASRLRTLMAEHPGVMTTILHRIQEQNLINFFDRLLMGIPESDRPVIQGTSAEQVAAIRTWMREHQPILDQVKAIDLSKLLCFNVPPEIALLRNLEDLDLSRNQLFSVSTHVRNLRNLYVLKLCNNLITSLTVEMGELPNLEDLDLSYNLLSSLSSQIRNLRNLLNLNLCKNLITSIPLEMVELRYFKTLNLERNPIAFLPPHIGDLEDLEDLDISCTQISSLPAELGKIPHLSTLNIADTPLIRKRKKMG